MENVISNVDLVTVIIPVYNVKPYLREALESVIRQTYQNLEILIVDDGSRDGSGEICDEFAARDGRIRVIHQENRGLSAARNAGLRVMTGQAVMFLDSDDAFHPRIVQTLLEAMNREQADVVMCKFSNYYTQNAMDPETADRKLAVPSIPEGAYDRIQALQALAERKINVSVWNKLYRRALWETIRFPDGHIFEDLDVTFRMFDQTQSVYVVGQSLYLYRIRPGNITNIWSEKRVRDWSLAYAHYEAFLCSHIPDVFTEEHLNEARQIWLHFMMESYVNLSWNRGEAGKDFRIALREQILNKAEQTGIAQCAFRTKAACRLLRSCPWALKMLFPVFSSIRYMVLWLKQS